MTNKRFLILIGKGKSTLTLFFLNKENTSTVSLKDIRVHSFSLSRLKEYNLCEEDILNMADEKLLEDIINGEKIQIERKYKNVISKKIDTKFVIHLQSKEQFKKLPEIIQDNSNTFYLDNDFNGNDTFILAPSLSELPSEFN